MPFAERWQITMNISKMIRIFLDKHPQIDYLQKVIRHSNKNDFRNTVLKLYKSPDYFEIQSNGSDNPGKIIYAIEYTNNMSGFYAVYKTILEYLFFCDYYGLIPVIKYPSDWLYSNGEENPFELFFKQPCGIGWEEVQKSRSVVYAKSFHCVLAHDILGSGTYYQYTENEIKEFGRLRKKYLHYSDEVGKALKKDIAELFGTKKILGVHIRGTDYKRAFNGHPTYVNVNDYIDTIHKVIERDYENIFIATDDQNVLEQIREEFNTINILTFQSFRSSGDVSVAMIKLERQNHGMLLGYEVIRDVVALATCAGFIGSLSMVSLAAQVEAVANNHEFEDKIVLTNGINKNNNHISKYEKQLRPLGSDRAPS